MKLGYRLLCLTLIMTIFTGCGSKKPSMPSTYTISGCISDQDGNGIEGVNISFSDGYGGVTTGNDGCWSKGGLKATITVTPSKKEWSFIPNNKQVNGANNSVNFVGIQNQYSISIKINGNGRVEKNPNQEYYVSDTQVQLKAIPEEGWIFDKWEGALSGTENPSSIKINSNVNITASFSKRIYPLNVSCIGSGTVKEEIVETISSNYEYGTTVRLTAKPDIGWSFDHWEGCVEGNENSIVVTVDKEMNVTAVFTQNQYYLTINTRGNGVVTKSPKNDSYVYGDEINLIASPQDGWIFSHWEGDVISNNNEASILMDGNKNVTAVFLELFTLNILTSGEGFVEKNPSQDSYVDGTTITLTASAKQGWSFDCWKGDLETTENPIVFKIDNNKEIEAVFNQNNYTVTIDSYENGSVTVIPEQESYVYGDVIEITPVPQEGWIFVHWEGSITGSDNPFKLTVDRNHNFKPVFANTIQSAIDLSVDGDVIIIPPGTYYENIDFKGKKITLKSQNPDDIAIVSNTIIDGNNTGSVITFEQRETEKTILTGFTIQNGFADRGGGIFINLSSPSITKNIVRNNSANYQGSAIYICSNSRAVIDSNTITGHNANNCLGTVYVSHSWPIINNNLICDNIAREGGGIYIHDISSYNQIYEAIISGNDINHNECLFGGGIFVNGAFNKIVGNTILNNIAREDGGGIYINNTISQLQPTVPFIVDNTISYNNAKRGGGIYVYHDNYVFYNFNNYKTVSKYEAKIEDNEIHNNIASVCAGGIYIWDASPRIKNNSISYNLAENYGGGGIYIYFSNGLTYVNDFLVTTPYSPAVLDNNEIVWNDANTYGGGIMVVNSTPTVINNTFSNNNAIISGGGLYVDEDSDIKDAKGKEILKINCPPNDELNNIYSGNTQSGERTEGSDVYFQ
ncbi:MAG TPA: hypothetical protein DC024_03580 [Clostridiales bacterium]|jgi:parallel beta-helix repeat protein|nr:hypothetical protein [Clostridiales bacterium]